MLLGAWLPDAAARLRMARPDPPLRIEQFLHCSNERTVVRLTDPGGQHAVVRKWFVRGAPADAEHELAMGRLAAGPGVPAHLGTGTDPATGRPFLELVWIPGQDLAALVAAQGALPAVQALCCVAAAARIAARLHALRTPEAPRGLSHNDLKPHNLLTTAEGIVLIDFEHSAPIGASAPPGTRGFAAPEAQTAAPATAARDVYALAAMLRWLLHGGAPSNPGLDPRLDAVLAPALGPAAARPDAATFAVALDQLSSELATSAEEATRDALWRGDLPAARDQLLALPATASHGRLAKQLARCERALRRLPDGATTTVATPAEPTMLLRQLLRCERLLRFLPRQPRLLAHRQALAAAAGVLVSTAAAHAAALCQKEEFAAARRFLEACCALVDNLQRTPVGLRVPPPEDLRALGPLHRTPLRFLEQQLQRTVHAEQELLEAIAAVQHAQREFDLGGAARAVAAMAGRYGGAAPSVVRHRDRLHQLQFYWQRVARAAAGGERLAQLHTDVDLRPLRTLLARCQEAIGNDASRSASGGIGLRSLLLALAALAEEFPELADVVTPASAALRAALEQVTSRAVQLLAEAEQQLQRSPIPVRPLQQTLARLDGWRSAEAFVDLPGRPRSTLLDHLEQLRLVLEQARATRDRLAQGAEQAIARGHWTTGLFDMERALGTGAEAATETDGIAEEDQRLRERLAEARRKKQDLDAAARRNIELQARYAALLDDAGGTFAARLQVLAERRVCLEFLSLHLPADRAQLHARDLRDVETQIALERASQAEQECDSTPDPELRLRLAEAALRELSASIAGFPGHTDPPARLLRSLDHWRRLAERCRADLERQHQERTAYRRSRRRRRWAAVTAAAVLAIAAGVLLPGVWSREAQAGATAHTADLGALARAAAALPEPGRSQGRAVLAALESLTRSTQPDPPSMPAFVGALDRFAAEACHDEPARRFAAQAYAAASASRPSALATDAASLAALGERLRAKGVPLPQPDLLPPR